MDTKTQPTVHVTSYKPSDDGHITLAGLTSEEVERMQGMAIGHWWVKGGDGRLEFAPAHEPAPAPTEDGMLPEWRTPLKEEGSERYQGELFEPMVQWRHQDPSILIQHLCGYSYTPQAYKEYAELLEGCGFACMRSRRGDNGHYWEAWFLPGLWAAQGRLKEALYGKSKEHKMRFALKFLREQVSFGTLDIAVQRYAQVLD